MVEEPAACNNMLLAPPGGLVSNGVTTSNGENLLGLIFVKIREHCCKYLIYRDETRCTSRRYHLVVQ